MPESLPDLFFADLDGEFDATRRLLAAYPDGQPDWRPHEKSMTLSTLAAHVAELPRLAELIAREDEWNVAKSEYQPTGARTRVEILELFDNRREAAREAISSLTLDDLRRSWKMHDGTTVFFEGARGPLLRRYLIGHTAHHRGQLTVYYRLLDVALPSIYGPTADGRA